MIPKLANSKSVFQGIKSQLKLDDADEIHAVARALMLKFYGLSMTNILSEKAIAEVDLSEIINRLNRHEPLQYILGEADFFGRKFKVNPSVLIPRPETELLIQEVIKEKFKSPRILDVGTGSGCIPITLKLEITDSEVHSVDVSNDALNIAKENAKGLNAKVSFILGDFLKDHPFPLVDVIVSNPPYIAESEKESMKSNVLDYEPHLALFVPDNDPLVFYRAIATKSKSILNPTGKIFVEINQQYGQEVKALFEQAGFNQTKIIKDLDGKDRIIAAAR